MEEMRALRIDERKDPHAIISDYRRLGEEHRVYHADFSDSDLVWTFLVVLGKSADVSPYKVPLYQNIIEDLSTATVAPSFDTVALRVRRVWQREGTSRLARFPPPSVPDSAGDAWSKHPSGGVAAYAFKPRPVQKAVGEWQDTGGPYRAWEGSGRPCLVCHRMWGLTDPHADTNDLCPWTCASAYSTGRAPPTAKAPPPRPDPPSDPPKAESTPQQPATFTFRPRVSADLLPDSLHVPTEPATDDCPSVDDDEPVLTSAFAFAAGASDDDDACWPALAESPVWIPKIAGTEF
ncbi:hypothetical protein CYMTET_35272 [Cymbomonas tetramitiformis]|uniref:Uncharacterized protein n=1 Tax=Cymbomonas tetramitiformis TaxID=36881 RepID=A0AAE0F9G0_9CHLO|nr:hypothetical protein CYMTET_35272 [Cymbomonas tetramitiformis]